MTTVELWLQVNTIPGEDDIYTTFPISSATALFGRNGAGKSRLLETIHSVLTAGNSWLGRPNPGRSVMSVYLMAPCGFDVTEWWEWVRSILLWAYEDEEGDVWVDVAEFGEDQRDPKIRVLVDQWTRWEDFAGRVSSGCTTTFGPSQTLDLLLQHPYLGLAFGFFIEMDGGYPSLLAMRTERAPGVFEWLQESESNVALRRRLSSPAAARDGTILMRFGVWDGIGPSAGRDTAWAVPTWTPEVLYVGLGDSGIDGRVTYALRAAFRQEPRHLWKAVESGFEIEPTVAALAEKIVEVANELAPAFVADHGRIEFAFDPNETSVSTGLRLTDGFVPCRLLGSGVARWVAVAVDAALARVDNPPVRIVGVSERRPILFLIDEPEAHLHPSAVDDVGRWIAGRRNDGDSVVVATHSAQLLAHPSIETLIHVSRVNGHLTTKVIDRSLAGISEVAALSGFRRRDLLLLWRGVLLVEGEHDLQVVEHFFGDRLAAERIVVQPLRGGNNVVRIFESELLDKLDIPVAVMLDDVRRSALDGNATSLTSEERKAIDLLRQHSASRSRRHLTPLDVVPLPIPDIWCVLPEEAVRLAFPECRFKNWDVTVAEWRLQPSAPLGGFKAWFAKSIGLDVDAKRNFVSRVLAKSDDLSARPPLHDAIDLTIRFVNDSEDIA